jgi:hypothetical protein
MSAPTFIDLLRGEVARMQTLHPERLGALSRAHAAIVEGHVVDTGDGNGKVLSRNGHTWYTTNGTCACTAAEFGKPCRHLQAWKLYQHIAKKHAQTIAPAPSPEVIPPASAPLGEAPAGLPEAACSANCYVMIAGRQVQVTLRGTSEDEVLSRLEKVLRQYPNLPQHTAKNPRSASGETSDTGQPGWCPIHHTQMPWNEGKNGRKGWHSHKTADGSWCKGGRP